MSKGYANISLSVKAAFWFVFCTLLQKAFSFVTVPIFTRIMSSDQYGLFNLYNAWLGIIVVLCTMNMESGVFVNGYVKEDIKEKRNELPISLLSLSFTLTAIIFTLLFFVYICNSSLISLPISFLVLMFIEVIANPVLRIWTVEQRFRYKYKLLVLITLILVFTQILLGIYFVYNADSYNKAYVRIFWNVIPILILGLMIYMYYIRRSHRVFLISNWIQILKLQMPLVPYNLSMVLLLSSSRILIGKYDGTKSVAIYSVAYSIGQIISMIKQSIVDGFHPWIYDKLKKKEFEPLQKMISVLQLLLATLAFLVSSLAPDLVRLFAPIEYYEAVYIVPFVSAIVIFALFNQVFVIIETYYEKTKNIMYSSIVACVLNIILNIILIPSLGFLIAGFTSLLSYMILSYINYYCICKISAFKNPFTWNVIYVTPIILSTIVSFVAFLYKYPFILRGISFCIIMICMLKWHKIIQIFKEKKI